MMLMTLIPSLLGLYFLPSSQALAPLVVATRRFALSSALSGLAAGYSIVGLLPAGAAETVGKDLNCNDSTCLGVWDGLLADCPHTKAFGGNAGCTSSQDDTPGIFSEPWDYSESNSLDWQDQMRLLVSAILLSRRSDQVEIDVQEGRYLRVIFTDKRETSIGEFYFTPNDFTVQFRIAAQRGTGGGLVSSSIRNIERAELIRKELRYLKLPVLRNRKRSLFFVESDLDTFGPGSAALGPPAEMRTGELEGRRDVDPKLDMLQQFPRQIK
jgi:hypothetical protein